MSIVDARARELVENAWLGLGDTSLIETTDPLTQRRTVEEVENPLEHLLGLMRQEKYFGFACKHIFNKTVPPYQLAILRELWNRPFPMLIGTRGLGKSFLLALYAMLRATFCQGVKIVVVGAAFRQAKLIFEYCENIWEGAPVLRDICSDSSKNGPRRDIDRCTMRIGESVITAIPLGDGTKIRGLRANIILSDEFASVPNEIFENVVSGFAAVSMDPIDKLKAAARRRAMKEEGLETPAQGNTILGLSGNQTVISGTAYYSFNHFADYWKRWKAIVESKGDRTKLEELFGGEVPEKFNWRDYSVIRIPVGMLPEGFMDDKHVSKQKATIHSSQYLMEYGACHGPNTKVITDKGLRKIINVSLGDMVLTHRGRFRPVSKVMTRRVDGDIVLWKAAGSNHETETTPEHPFWDGEGWSMLATAGRCHLANLVELSGSRSFDVRACVGEYLECEDGTIYPRPGMSKFSRDELFHIRSSGDTQSALAVRYGVRQGVIHNVIKKRRRPKNAIPAVIPLDYHCGLVVGYYAAEGSLGANGRAVAFALDGHVNERLEAYVDQLVEACRSVFGFTPKVYRNGPVANVTINQRLVANLMKWICPGVSHTKLIRHDVLFSNAEFMKGFVVGYWNGDGHLSAHDSGKVLATCVNESLLAQVRMAVSFFGISGFLGSRAPQTSFFRGKACKTREVFNLRFTGAHARRFREVFYGEDHGNHQGGKQVVVNDGLSTSAPFTSRSVVPFDGWVYNLEVEEDNSYSLLNATVHNCFPNDSNGFYKRSLIEKCVVGRKGRAIEMPSCGEVRFHATLKGDPTKHYVMAIDPASEQDNFSIVVLELWPEHRRIVHCWTTTRQRHKAKLNKGLAQEEDFYHYVTRKIRELMRAFPCDRIGMDSQGGGIAVMEALADRSRLASGELPVLLIIDDDKPSDSDFVPGHHILELVHFSKADWVSEANHGMRMDFQSQVLLFPEFDPALLALAGEEDKMSGRVKMGPGGEEALYDTLEDVVIDIEQLKDELATIVHTQTGKTMRDHWDVPEVKQAGGKKGRLRKDRYSALLMANMVARTLQRAPNRPQYAYTGGFARDLAAQKDTPRVRPHYQNPLFYEQYVKGGVYGAIVRR